MNRRAFAGALATGLTAGCLDRRDPSSGGDAPDDATTATSGDLWIRGVYPREVERTFFDYEYVELENAGDEPLDVSGYVVEYDDRRTYAVDDLTLEPGALLVVSSRSGDGTVLEQSPPVYHRFAGFGSGAETSALGERGTLVVRNSLGEAAAERRYEDYGEDDPPDGDAA
ncbi:lamin tail domain-containing protein [Halostella sp. JP-L12]|uniref:lamin tail domain-containing protein n=1 Tax=Halostella TaxID=1843185 RepID=UPI0013CE4109|nr:MULTISPECIES: lamin tail domain-containing protein [Halostella]NHN47320.1 lamin tail domain-containing protein [Halostella sp. JP-L12]